MGKSEIDQVYHLLRQISNEATENKDNEPTAAVYGLAEHLLEGGNYLKLLQYLKFYGENYLVTPTVSAIRSRYSQPQRIVEFGAGLGWLGRGIANSYDHRETLVTTLFIDKRQWTLIDLVADLETPEGIARVQAVLKPGDMIVMSDFLHCVNNPSEIINSFSEYPMVILEYLPTSGAMQLSYSRQIGRYGATAIRTEWVWQEIANTGRKADVIDIDPYVLVLIDAETG